MTGKFTVLNEKTLQNAFFSKIIAAFLLLMFSAAALQAQGKGASVMIYAHGKAGTDAEAVSHLISQLIGQGMLDKFPCIDQFDDASLAALLGWERARELLGQEPNPELMQSVAGAVGARYVVSVSATTLPNGQTSATVSVMDSQTGKTLSRADFPPTEANNAVDAADQLVKKVMQDLANIFKNQCEPHWTGTISYSFKYQKSERKTTEGIPGAMESNVTVNTSSSDEMEDFVEAFLQPMSLGAEDSKIMSRVVHRYTRRYELTQTRSGDIICRPKNANSYKSQSSGSSTELIDERGQNVQTMTVYLYVGKSGKYEISVNYPSLITERNESRSGNQSACGSSKPFSESNSSQGSPESDAYTQSGSFKVSGEIDPKNPDVLSGKKVTGDLENGQFTIAWNLRLVKPKTKK